MLFFAQIGLLFFLGQIVLPVFAATSDVGSLNEQKLQKQKEIERLEKSIEEYKKKINQKRLEAVSLSNQLSILDNTRAQIELDVQATQDKLDIIELERETLETGIAQKEEVLTRERAMIGELLRTVYYLSDKNYLEIAASEESFSEAYNNIQYTRKVQKDLGENVRAIRAIKEDLEKKKDQVKEQETLYTEVAKELEEKQLQLQSQADAKQQLLAQTQSSELTYKTLLSQLKSQYQQIENEISGIERQIRTKLEEQDKLSQIDDSQGTVLSWPTQSRYITARFHDPSYPFRNVFEHSGIDIRAAHGTPLHAAASGYIARAKYCGVASCYSYVLIVHSEGVSSLYGHLSGINVKEDQFVTRGDIIGYSGGTPGTAGAGPFVTGPHLHFEVRKNGIPVNPLGFLIKDY
ncbi:MAG: hypothetical protein A3J66_03830 [Candidatus Magasanikbacteria bacterium RIFCSPHIGHO2_02_FULL_47_14]|uniref:M23ase beta-sheet core domain-containing protein n=1 Tax=Candidatus Magasanikbacteria bacterium RIFCSPHIGHO2_02_FULL_47_14 TaxID=1798680 RepID=A0A1F6M100_9BACT|nr:MAG: hypothetical protein A3J66_03830 [Candidatus Magasanikbacteria bacterium RIFCSPHIGHO2_02_FULL_47_14]